MKNYIPFLFLFLIIHTTNAQDTIRYLEHKEDGVHYSFQQSNNQIEGFVSSDTGFQTFTGKRINQYRVTLFDAFTNKPLDALPFELSKADKTGVIFHKFSDSAKFRLNSNDAGPGGNFSLTLVRPDFPDDSRSGDIYASIVKNLTNDTASDLTAFDELFSSLSNKFKKQYLSANQELYKNYGDECYACNWKNFYQVSPIYFDDKRLSVNISKYAFTGGAHGMLHNTVINFDLDTGDLISLDSLLDKPAIDQLNKLINKKLRENNSLQSGQSLRSVGFFNDVVKTSSNYCITNKGINFIYNPYEIAPYAMGVITVFIPFNELNSDKLNN
ncbi:MAG: DUF3298 domain-containing protein [Bacteroidota bacterium]